MNAAAPPARELSGSLRLAAAVRGDRTTVDVMRYDGLLRCSRTFDEAGGAARVVVAQLGPGFVRGDRFTIDGALGPNASLVVGSQSASRTLGAGEPSELRTAWNLETGARLTFSGEPTIAYTDSTHRAQTVLTLGSGASVAWLDAIGSHGAFVRYDASLRVFFGAALAVHDVLRLTPERLDGAIATAWYLRSGMTAERSAELLRAADVATCGASDAAGVAIGTGSPAAGGVVVRARGPHVRAVRAALVPVLTELRRIDARDDAPFG